MVFFRYSPNHSRFKRKKKDIKVIVIHYTGMQSEVEATNRLLSSKHKVSCHYLINQKGKLLQMVKDEHIAWHAGKSKWKNLRLLNKNSIGIELVNPGHQYGYKKFYKKQILSLIKLLKKLVKKYNINKSNLVGHSDIAPLRKKDPGEKFPWKTLFSLKLGIWHNLDKKKLKENRGKKITNKEKLIFLKNINKIGYQIKFNVKKVIYMKKITLAFQRRFRPELISGIIDRECFLISKKLVFRL
jgi:N-acetylmuramoyl-L-alanine amidase